MFFNFMYRVIPVNTVHCLSFIVILAIFTSETKFRTYFESGWKPVTLNLSRSFFSNTQETHILFYSDQGQPLRIRGASIQEAPESSPGVLSNTTFNRADEIYIPNRRRYELAQKNMPRFANSSQAQHPLDRSKFRKVKQEQEFSAPAVVVDMHTENTSHLLLTLRRLVKKYSIKKVIDFSCQYGGHWIPSLVYALEYEVPNFRYHCIVSDRQSLVEMAIHFKQLESATVIEDTQPWDTRFSGADMALMWYIVGFYAPQATWRFINGLQNAQVTFAIIPNFPSLTQNVATGSPLGRVNVRRTPYRFTQPMQVVNNMSFNNSIPKQLLMYNISRIRA